MKTAKIVGLVLLIAGAVVLIYGIVQFTDFRNSAAGKVAGAIGKLTSSRAEKEVQSIVMMIAGGIAALTGLYITVRK